MTTKQKLVYAAFAVSVAALATGLMTAEQWKPFVVQLIGSLGT